MFTLLYYSKPIYTVQLSWQSNETMSSSQDYLSIVGTMSSTQVYLSIADIVFHRYTCLLWTQSPVKAMRQCLIHRYTCLLWAQCLLHKYTCLLWAKYPVKAMRQCLLHRYTCLLCAQCCVKAMRHMLLSFHRFTCPLRA